MLLVAGGCAIHGETDETSNFRPAYSDCTLCTGAREYVAKTVKTRRRATHGFTMQVQYTNTTDEAVCLARCHPDDLEPLFFLDPVGSDADMESAYGSFNQCPGHERAIRVEPGASRIDEYRISGPYIWQSYSDEYIGIMEGTFKMGYWAEECNPESTKPAERIMSNAFTVSLKE